MSNNFMSKYFGPLPREYCIYFYILSIIFGSMFALSVISIITFIILHFKKVNAMFIVNSALVLINLFLAYISNRLLHTMCVKAI